MMAKGLIPLDRASFTSINMIEDAPSLFLLAFAAVMVPPLALKTVFSVENFSGVNRLNSSSSKTTVGADPGFLCAISIGMISLENSPVYQLIIQLQITLFAAMALS